MQVHIFWIFSFYWDVVHPVRTFSWWKCIQNTIRIFSNSWFTALPIWIFFLCGQLIVLYFDNVKNRLEMVIANQKVANESSTNQIFKYLRCMKQLNLAIELLHRRFGTILTATCFISVMNLFTSAFYAINFVQSAYVPVTIWDTLVVLNSFVRLWLMGHVSDRMRKVVNRSFSVEISKIHCPFSAFRLRSSSTKNS